MSAILESGIPEFRVMTEHDLDHVMEIEPRAYTYPWTKGIFSDCIRVGYYCLVMELDGELVGYGVMSLAAGESHILNLTVKPEFQGQGLGRALMNYLIDVARRLHAEIALLEVRPSNKQAIGLYTSMGFNEVGSRKNYYPSEDGREDALILALNL